MQRSFQPALNAGTDTPPGCVHHGGSQTAGGGTEHGRRDAVVRWFEIAQVAERPPVKRDVAGSSPAPELKTSFNGVSG